MKLITLTILMLLASCGKIKLSDSAHKVNVKAETTSYIIVRLEFIKDIKEMCRDIYPEYEYENAQERKKLVSQCTLDKMTLIDLGAISDYNAEVCSDPKTQQEIDICKLLDFNNSQNYEFNTNN